MSAFNTLKEMASGWKSYAASAAIAMLGGGVATGVVVPEPPPVVVDSSEITTPPEITFENVEQATIELAAQAAATAAAKAQADGSRWAPVLGVFAMLFGAWGAANRAALAKLQAQPKRTRGPNKPKPAEGAAPEATS